MSPIIHIYQAIIFGLLQGITELFPVSSLGHAVLVPAWLGGSLKQISTNKDSAYLTFTVALHLASALALLWIFRKRWVVLIRAGFQSLRGKRSVDSQVFWLLVITSIPAAVLGLAFEKTLRSNFAKPLAAAIFLFINGFILFGAERLSGGKKGYDEENTRMGENELIAARIQPRTAVTIGFGQSLALLAGISRFGVTTSVGLMRKLSHHVAADFAFLAATPIILLAAIYKAPELLNHSNASLRTPALVGGIASFIATYISAKFLVRWFKTRTLYPFAIYCFIIGIASIIRFA